MKRLLARSLAPPLRVRSLLLALVAGLVLVGPRLAMAQSEESSTQFWLQDHALQEQLRERAAAARPQHRVLFQRPTHLIRRAKPLRGFTLSKPEPASALPEPLAKQEPGTPAAQTAPGAPAPALTGSASASPDKSGQAGASAPAHVFTIAVLGDSLGQFLEQGLSDLYAGRPDVAILSRAKESTGLTRDDYYDWPQAARELAAGKDHIDLAVIMIGSNDRQPIREGSAVYDPLTPKWRQIYATRVQAIVKTFHDHKIPLLWVGAPIMKSASLSEGMLAFNDIYKTTTETSGDAYIDIWDLFSDDSGQFALYGPDVNGDTARLRASDGVHFTRAGARKLAQSVSAEIKRMMDNARPQSDQAIAGIAPQVAPAEPLTQPISAVVGTPPAGRRNAGDLRNLVPAPAAPIHPVIPIRPASGPVVALTTPIVAPDGQLVTRALVQSSALGETSEQDLSEGAPIAPRPGRADDYRWPRD